LDELVGIRSAVLKWIRDWRLIIWIGSIAGQSLRRTRLAPAGPKEVFTGSGLYSGLLDAAQDLGIGSWSLTRKRLPAPPVAPSADADVQAYLSGYFLGHAMLTLAWQRSSSGKPYRTPQPSATITAYTSAIATPVAQRLLAAPGEQSVMSAHQFACLLAREIGRPILDVETEVGLYRWLAGRSGIAAPAYLDELLGRLRQKRQDRGRAAG
jgi:hypothetical protein